MTARPELRVADRGSVPVAYLSGDVDVSVSASLRERLLRAVENQDVGLVVDLSDARYVDSAGINVLFELAERLKVRQLAFAIVVPEDGLIERVFALVDLGSVVDIHRSVDSAVHTMRAKQDGS